MAPPQFQSYIFPNSIISKVVLLASGQHTQQASTDSCWATALSAFVRNFHYIPSKNLLFCGYDVIV